eukprot:scaffold10332_cov101-Cylindrotheca_fusiformis.AAC.3
MMIEHRLVPCRGILVIWLALSYISHKVEARLGNPLIRTKQTHYTAVPADTEPDENDGCRGISTVSELPYITGGTPTGGDNDSASTTKLTLDLLRESQLKIELADSNLLDAPGVWYRLSGHDMILEATVTSTSQANNTIVLFQDTRTGGTCQPSEVLSVQNHGELSWFAKEGTTYFIKVVGETSPDESGIFVLQIEELLVPHPTNDQCRTSRQMPTLSEGEQIMATGSSYGARPHGVVNEACGLTNPYARGLFYSIEGTGRPIAISFRPDVTGQGELEMVLLVNDFCNACIARSEFMTTQDSEQTIVFDTVENERYTILISGKDISDAGVFQLTITDHQNRLLKEDESMESPPS